VRRKLAGKKKTRGTYLGPRGIAEVLMDSVPGDPVVVDYGSGLAYVSYEIAQANKNSKIFLVDIECIVLEFAIFRLNRIGAHVQTPVCVYTSVSSVLSVARNADRCQRNLTNEQRDDKNNPIRKNKANLNKCLTT